MNALLVTQISVEVALKEFLAFKIKYMIHFYKGVSSKNLLLHTNYLIIQSINLTYTIFKQMLVIKY